MKRFLTVLTLFVMLTSLCAVQVFAQATGTIKGFAKDENGKPITDATVELDNIEKGAKQTLKVNSKGEYFSAGIAAGTYNAILIDKDGKRIDAFGKVPIAAGQETTVNFDLKKDKIGGPTPEELKKIEEVKASNENIKNLNVILAQTRDLMKAGNYDQAIAMLQPAAEKNPQQDLLWGYLGDAYTGDKKYPEAVEAYNKAIALKPKNGGYLSGLANAYAKSGQNDKAVEQYNAAAQAEPANAAMYFFNEGAVFTNTQHPKEAVAAFDKSIAADPNRAEAYYYKGENLIAMAQLDSKTNKMIAPPGTAESFQKYIELKPDGPLVTQAKGYLDALGAKVETTYGKGKTPPKKQ